MPDELQKQFDLTVKFMGKSTMEDWFAMPIDGTVFSGHPTRTTLGNTFRSLLYMYFYLEQAGFRNPWKMDDRLDRSKQIFVAASGDDVVVWCPKTVSSLLYTTILKFSSRKKISSEPIGLGQCIKEISLRDWWDIDFCSKVAYCDNRECLDSWTLTRDFSALLNKKMYYTERNITIHNNPVIHAMALYD